MFRGTRFVQLQQARVNRCHGVMAKFCCRNRWGMETTAVNKGWNAMMDESYLNITMKYLGSWRRLGWKDQSEMPWFKCVFLSENTYYRSTLFNSYMKWSCKRQLWIEMARVVLHSAICWGKASQHSDSSLTRNPNSRSHILAFFKTQKLPLVPFSNWRFLWVGFAAPHFAEGSWYRQKHVCSFRTPSASRNSRPFFPSTNIGPSKDGQPVGCDVWAGDLGKITRGGSLKRRNRWSTHFFGILRVEPCNICNDSKSGCW